MDDFEGIALPDRLPEILEATRALGFLRSSDLLVGNLLRTLAATKPGGRLLELGTGTGVGTSWLLDGMDRAAGLVTVERDAAVQEVARRVLGADPRVRFVTGDGEDFMRSQAPESYDLIFADGGAGKFTHLDLALALLRPGAIYLVDNMTPHLFHPPGRAAKLREFWDNVATRTDLLVTRLSWSSGVILCTRRR